MGLGHNVFWRKAIHNVLILPIYYQTECGLEWAKIFHIVPTKNEYFYKIGLYYLIKIKTRMGVQYRNRLIWLSFLWTQAAHLAQRDYTLNVTDITG